MKKYRVELPLVGSLRFSGIEAENEIDAILAAQNVEWRLHLSRFDGSELPDVDLGDEFETPPHAIQGNVSYLPLSSAFAEEMDEDE